MRRGVVLRSQVPNAALARWQPSGPLQGPSEAKGGRPTCAGVGAIDSGGCGCGDGDGDNDPAHPCPICLVNEDDHGKPGQCFECGRLYCGECNVPATMGRIENCPTYRAPLRVPAEVGVERLVNLLKRSPGRHTPRAQNNLAGMYHRGTGVPQDYPEAVRLCRLAADQGHAGGQINLGRMYNRGTGAPQDYTEAAWLYRSAADQGHAIGQINLGLMYDDGTGVPQDHTEAVRCTASPPTRGTPSGSTTSG